MKKFKLVSLIMAACMLFGTMSGFAADGVTADIDNPAMQRIFTYNFDEGWGSGVTNDGNYDSTYIKPVNGPSIQDSVSGVENDKYLCIPKNNNGLISLDNRDADNNKVNNGILEAGWYRVDFDAAADSNVSILARILSSASEITEYNDSLVDTSFDNYCVMPTGKNSGGTGWYNVMVLAKASGLSNSSLFFKANGTNHYTLSLTCSSSAVYVDNITLYKVGDGEGAAPTQGLMNVAALANKNVTFTAKVKNNTASAQDATLIYAAYDKDENLKKVSFATYTEEDENAISAGKSVYPKLALDFTDTADVTGYTVKAYLWDNMSNIKPLGDVINPVGNEIVEKWDFEDGTVMGWSNGGISGVTVDYAAGKGIDGSGALKVTFPATDGLKINDAYNYFFVFTDEFAHLQSRYGDGKYAVKASVINGGTTRVLQYDIFEVGMSPYADHTGGAVTAANGTTKIWNNWSTTAAGANLSNYEGQYVLYSKPVVGNNVPTYFNEWYTSEKTNYDFVETSNSGGMCGNLPRKLLFRFRVDELAESTVYIDNVILEKIN